MFRSIIPREDVFFDHFEKICALMTEAARHLRSMLEKGGPYDEAAQCIKGIESEADELTHRSIKTLHQTFVTPLDRQDILRLVVGLDDILDTTEAVASLLNLYNPRKTLPETGRLANLLVQGTEKVTAMVGLLRQLSKESERILALAGGWRVIETLGMKMTKLKPVHGFCAETAAASSILLSTVSGIPVSTTHTITGAIIGLGATTRLSAIRWGVAYRIV